MIGISLDEADSEEMLGKFIVRREMNWLHGWTGSNSDMIRNYGIQFIPALILIGPDGKVLLSAPNMEKLTAKIGD